MKILKLTDGNYPTLLRQLFDAPATLYAEGHVACLSRPCVAVVGTRRCTAYGEAMAFEIGRDLARAGVCVVSGLAYGIDAAAHRGALAGGGVTAAVVAQGLECVRPTKNRLLARQIVENGGVILSEREHGDIDFKTDYLVRNRIVAGLCRIVVVVEAPLKSGARNTASQALEQGRDVFAVPGRTTDAMSVGCNQLIFDGAGVARSAKDVLESLRKSGYLEGVRPVWSPVPLAGLEARVLEFVRVDPRHAGELVDLCGAPIGAVYEALCGLEMKGLVWAAGDGRYGMVRGGG